MKAKIKETELATITGRELIKTPYTAHKNMPVDKIANIPIEMSLVDFVFHVLIT